MAAPLIELTTLIEQPTISINKKLYEILHPDQLGVIDFQRLVSMGSKVSALLKKSDPDAADAAELTEIINNLTDQIMSGVPTDVRSMLTEAQRIEVAEVFMMLPRAQTRRATKKAKAEKANAKAPRSAGSKQRSGARSSTAAIPSGG